MAKQSLVAGLDVGSNQVCCVAGVIDDDARLVKVLGSSVIACSDGIKAGAVINVQEASMAIGRAFEEAEKSAGSQISNVILAVHGNFVKADGSKGVANIYHHNREITEETIANALDSAKKIIKLNPDHEILQIVPKEFILNQQKGIQNPIGMEGTYIEVDTQAFIASSSNIATIMKAVGTQCDEKVYSYLAASDIIVTKEEKELGCLVVDFGGLTTGLVHYYDGILRYTDEVQAGSDYITRDIMHKLRASYAVSKEVKETQGAAFVTQNFENKEFEYKGADGRSVRKYDRIQLLDVIQPRVEQILDFIDNEMKKSPYGNEFLSGGIILTGGGSLLEGLPEAFEKYFGCSVRIGLPKSDRVVGPNEIVSNPVYTAAIGAIASTMSSSYAVCLIKPSGNNIFSRAIRWIADMF